MKGDAEIIALLSPRRGGRGADTSMKWIRWGTRQVLISNRVCAPGPETAALPISQQTACDSRNEKGPSFLQAVNGQLLARLERKLVTAAEAASGGPRALSLLPEFEVQPPTSEWGCDFPSYPAGKQDCPSPSQPPRAVWPFPSGPASWDTDAPISHHELKATRAGRPARSLGPRPRQEPHQRRGHLPGLKQETVPCCPPQSHRQFPTTPRPSLS